MTHDRIVALDGPLNFRDIGGYKNNQGQSVKWNKIYRSDSLSSLSYKDKITLTKLRITVDCDLRSNYEKNSAPDVLWDHVKYVDAPLYSNDLNEDKANNKLFRFFHHLPDLKDNFIGQIYQRAILNTHSQEEFAKIFAELLELPEDEALVYHCSAGKDRTGMTSALILMALGVDDDTIARDYLLTNTLYDFALAKNFPSTDEISSMIAKMNVTKGEGTAIHGITDTIRAGWGNFDSFFKKELGFSQSDLNQFRQMYLEQVNKTMVTLSDVAKEANVSKMTVSRVINHPEQVTPELRSLVEQAIAKLDYHPNSIAQALVNNRSNVVKFVTLEDIDSTEPYYINLLFGFARGLNEKQYAMQLVADPTKIETGRADGYLITGARNKNYELFDQLDKPFVLFGENHRGYDFVDNDNQLGEKIATEYAMNRFYKQIIFIGIDIKEPFEYSREAGYINTLQKNQIIPQIYRVPNHSHSAQDLIHEHFSEFKKDTCFICASDRIAIGVERQLRIENGKVPEDFGVIGYDGVFLDQVANPKLTTIKQPIMEMGEMLANMLLKKIEQSGSPQGEVMIKPTLIRRGSTR